MKKYELTDTTIEHEGRTLYRIRVVRDFSDIKAGEPGGFIEECVVWVLPWSDRRI